MTDIFDERADVNEVPIFNPGHAGRVAPINTEQPDTGIQKLTGRTGIGGGELVNPDRMRNTDADFYSDDAGLLDNSGIGIDFGFNESQPEGGRMGRQIVGD